MAEFLGRGSYSGRVYPINPRYESVGSWRCYPTVESLPEAVDVLVCTVPVAHAFDAIEAAAKRGVLFTVLITGGFGEGMGGEQGLTRLARLRSICKTTGMQVVGPNTVGIVNFRSGIPLTFADWCGRDTGKRDGIAVLSHSGSVGGLIFSMLQLNNVGVSYWAGLGNEAVLTAADFIEYFRADPAIHTIVCYLEGISDGRKFLSAATAARAAGKHIVVLKAGKSDASRRATQNHTIKNPTEKEVYDTAFKQAGVIQVESLEELAYAVKLLPPISARLRGRIGILSGSGGANSVLADHVVAQGLMLPELPPNTQAELAKHIPDYGAISNPVDLSGDALTRGEILFRTLEVIERDQTVDTWLLFGRAIIDRYPTEIHRFASKSAKAVVVSSGIPAAPDIEKSFADAGVPLMKDPEICIRAIGAIAKASASTKSKNWLSMEARIPGDWMVAEHELLSVLPSYVPPTEKPEPFPVGCPVTISILQDRDFGPIIRVQAQLEGLLSRSHRVDQVLPISNDEVRTIACQFLGDSGNQSVTDTLARTIDALVAIYQSSIDIAGVSARLAVGAHSCRPESLRIARCIS